MTTITTFHHNIPWPRSQTRQNKIFQRSLQLGLISNPTTKEEPSAPQATPPSEELLLHVGGMWCTSCTWLVEHALGGMPGVIKVEVSFAADLAKVQYQPQILAPERIIDRINSLGYKASKYSTHNDRADAERRDLIIRTGLAAFLWANVMSFSLVFYAGYFEQISGSVGRRSALRGAACSIARFAWSRCSLWVFLQLTDSAWCKHSAGRFIFTATQLQ